MFGMDSNDTPILPFLFLFVSFGFEVFEVDIRTMCVIWHCGGYLVVSNGVHSYFESLLICTSYMIWLEQL